MTLTTLDAAARGVGLTLRGAFHPDADHGAPQGTGTLVLLGPDEPGFWPRFTASPEYADGGPDPLDRWSKRVIGALADSAGGQAIFPSDGPPYPRFLDWARASRHCWPAPVGLLVHQDAGLFISYRGAIALPDRLPLPPAGTRPCDACDAPCVTACPVDALTASGYDVPACQAHVYSDAGVACRDGCLVRRACPVARGFARLPVQSAFHMAAFMRHYRR